MQIQTSMNISFYLYRAAFEQPQAKAKSIIFCLAAIESWHFELKTNTSIL